MTLAPDQLLPHFRVRVVNKKGAGMALRVDIVSDVVCPWCAVGFKQLEAAAKATGQELDIYWHPFELNPNIEGGEGSGILNWADNR